MKLNSSHTARFKTKTIIVKKIIKNTKTESEANLFQGPLLLKSYQVKIPNSEQ